MHARGKEETYSKTKETNEEVSLKSFIKEIRRNKKVQKISYLVQITYEDQAQALQKIPITRNKERITNIKED